MLRTAFEKLKELNRHGIPLADLKGNIKTLIGSVEIIAVMFRIADTDAESLNYLGSRRRSTLAVVESCDSCLRTRINASWPSYPTGYVMLLATSRYDFVTPLV